VSFLVEDLIESVKDRSFAPISQSTFQDADILRILNDELNLKVVADLQRSREDFFYYEKTVSIVANKPRYMVPKGAIGNTVVAVFYVDSNGREYPPLTRRDISDTADFTQATGQPIHFYFVGDQIGLYPYPDESSGSLRFVIPKRPNKLILTESCAKITNVSSAAGTTTFTVDTDLTASLSVGSKVDFLRADSPYALWADEVAITAITTTTIAVATTGVDDVDGTVLPQDNDYICPTGYANIAQIPEEYHAVLCQMAANRMLRGMGDLNKLAEGRSELKELRDEAMATIRQRAETAPDKVYIKSALLKAFRGG
jgi:hypothetical protein